MEVALFPGGHTAYSAHPLAFARRLAEALETR